MKNNMEARTYAHTHIVLAKVQHEENRPAHLVLHTRDKQLKSAPHAGHQSMCCHICSGSTVSKGHIRSPRASLCESRCFGDLRHCHSYSLRQSEAVLTVDFRRPPGAKKSGSPSPPPPPSPTPPALRPLTAPPAPPPHPSSAAPDLSTHSGGVVAGRRGTAAGPPAPRGVQAGPAAWTTSGECFSRSPQARLPDGASRDVMGSPGRRPVRPR